MAEAYQAIKGDRRVQRLEYRPQTFRQQGAVVPFTTRILSQARVRWNLDERTRDGDLVEVLLPGFAGSNSTYVTSLARLGDIISMTVHDRALSERIIDVRAGRPVEVRHCWADVARSGLAGARAAVQAQEWREAMQATIHGDYIVMLRQLARRDKVAITSAMIDTLEASPGSGDLLYGALHELKSEPGRQGTAFGVCLIELAELLSGVGLKGSKSKSLLRDLTWRLGELSRLMKQWGRQTMSDIGPAALVCGNASSISFDMATRCLDRIDAMAIDLPALVRDWESRKVQLARLVSTLFWILDGWDFIIDLWDQAVGRKVTAEDAMYEIFRILPVVPPREVASMPDLEEKVREVHRFREPFVATKPGASHAAS